MESVYKQDDLSYALSACLLTVHESLSLKECRVKRDPSSRFLVKSISSILDSVEVPSKLNLFVAPIRQRLGLITQQGKDNFIQVHGPSQAEMTEVTLWLASGDAPLIPDPDHYNWTGEYGYVVKIFLRFLGYEALDDNTLIWAWMLKLDLYCVYNRRRRDPTRVWGAKGDVPSQPWAVAQYGLRFLWRLCGGKEAFGALLYSIVYPTQANPYTDRTLRGIFGSFGVADTILEFTDVDREGPLTMPTYDKDKEVFTSPLATPMTARE